MFETLKRTAVAAAFIGCVTAATLAFAQKDTGASKVVAKVNGVEITEKDVSLAMAEIGHRLARIPKRAHRRVLIEFLIENHLIAEAAKEKKVAESDDFKSRMSYWKLRSLRESYFERIVQNAVTDAEVRKFYDEKVTPAAKGEEIRAAHILVKSEDKAKEIYEQLVHEGDFTELAKKNSIDPGSRARGGDLGYFSKGMMVPAFEKAAFALKKDEISQPVKSQFGWHIIKLLDRRSKQPPPFETVKQRVRILLIRQRVKELVAGLRKSANLEYVDPEIRKQVEGEKAKKK